MPDEQESARILEHPEHDWNRDSRAGWKRTPSESGYRAVNVPLIVLTVIANIVVVPWLITAFFGPLSLGFGYPLVLLAEGVFGLVLRPTHPEVGRGLLWGLGLTIIGLLLFAGLIAGLLASSSKPPGALW